MKKFFVILACLLMACSGCSVGMKQSEIDQLKATQGSEDLPLPYADPAFWVEFWSPERLSTTLGVTFCYGIRGSIVSLNPTISPYQVNRVLKHEHFHQHQIREKGCVEFLKEYETVEGVVLIEGQAMLAEGIQYDDSTMVSYLHAHDRLQSLSRDSVETLYKNVFKK